MSKWIRVDEEVLINLEMVTDIKKINDDMIMFNFNFSVDGDIRNLSLYFESTDARNKTFDKIVRLLQITKEA